MATDGATKHLQEPEAAGLRRPPPALGTDSLNAALDEGRRPHLRRRGAGLLKGQNSPEGQNCEETKENEKTMQKKG